MLRRLRSKSWRFAINKKHGQRDQNITINQFRFIKIQPNTNSVIIPQSLVLKSIVLVWILIDQNWATDVELVFVIKWGIKVWYHGLCSLLAGRCCKSQRFCLQSSRQKFDLFCYFPNRNMKIDRTVIVYGDLLVQITWSATQRFSTRTGQ